MSNHENTCTVKEFLTAHVGEAFSMMTPSGFVELTADQAKHFLDGQEIPNKYKNTELYLESCI